MNYSASANLNFKRIENLFGEVSLNPTKHFLKSKLFSPASFKAQDVRSQTTLSTNSSYKYLRLSNSISEPFNLQTCGLGPNKSEIKRNRKLNQGGNGQEFKIPSPRIKPQTCDRARIINNKRYRSVYGENKTE